MNPFTRTTIAGAAAIAFAGVAFATSKIEARAREAERVRSALIERGAYLVEHVGMCADCHSPRGEDGQFDRSRWLLGSALAFQPTAPIPWSPVAPPIAGLPSMNEAQAIEFLMTGRRPDGSRARPPMPEYRLSDADARAVTAYLKVLAN